MAGVTWAHMDDAARRTSFAEKTWRMKRVAVIGPVGAGKTTFGRSLSKQLGVPFVDLDDLYWRRDPIPTDAEWIEIHDAAVVEDAWVIAGDYRAVARTRFAMADAVVWLDYPRRTCIVQATRRHLRGYPSRLRDCLRWIWAYPGHGRRETERTLAEFTELPVHRLRSRSELRGLRLPD